jgi:hypothetical protein
MIRLIPRNVWVAGWVSFFMDVSSEMVYPLVPFFLSSTLGVSKSTVGLIEGLAEATASVLKLFSGAVSDRFGKNKLLMGVGYGISTASRPLLAMAGGWGMVLTSRMADRVGKGIRTAPRDAIIALSTSSDRLGSAFGFHRAMDTAGAVAGPALALLLLAIWPSDYRAVFWFSILPGIIAVLLIVFFISADGRTPTTDVPFTFSLDGFDPGFVTFMVVIGLFSLGNSSNAFLILKAYQAGMSGGGISAAYLSLQCRVCRDVDARRHGCRSTWEAKDYHRRVWHLRLCLCRSGLGDNAVAHGGTVCTLWSLYGLDRRRAAGLSRDADTGPSKSHRLWPLSYGCRIGDSACECRGRPVVGSHRSSRAILVRAAMSALAMAIFIYSGRGIQAKR